MTIYGTALLSLCLPSGMNLGKLIGMAIGVDANLGGVGIAMLLACRKSRIWKSP